MWATFADNRVRLIKHCLIGSVIFLVGGLLPVRAQEDVTISAKFMPSDGKVLLIVGQDLGAVGGMPGYTGGYVDQVGIVPGGLTTYTGFPSLGGLATLDNWGSGDVSAQMLVDEPQFKNSALVIGFWMADNHEEHAAAGDYDAVIDELGRWIKAQDRPVFLRIGYEFDGPWNHYEPEAYVAAYRRIVDRLAALGVTNCATVWQSATFGSTYAGHDWLDWYPGDEVVDWFGLSYFNPPVSALTDWLDLARAHGKPVMIAEATPQGHVTVTEDGAKLWEDWYAGFFTFIYDNSDLIKAVAYINVEWDAQPMWQGQGWGDSRVQANPVILERWLTEIQTDRWLSASPELFDLLSYTPAP
jgi:hypothetical protein